MLQIEYEHTFKAALSRGINLFLGSGFALMAKDKFDEYLPTGNQLRAELITKFNLQNLESLSLSQISAIIEASNKADFSKYISRILQLKHLKINTIHSKKLI